MNFYAVIIGTEILNNRRQDKHFEFLKDELAKYGHELFASLIIKDDEVLMKNTYEMVKKDQDAVLFSFGGIGSTPDDLTREIAADVFTSKPLKTHEKFKQDILDRFGKEAYPHRIHMADIPDGSDLIFNPINNMSAFSLQNRYFFVPGFPSMAHPMLEDVIAKNFSQSRKKYRYTLIANTSENTLNTLMHKIPKEIELSSLPMFKDNKPLVELSLSGYIDQEVREFFNMFIAELELKKIEYKLT